MVAKGHFVVGFFPGGVDKNKGEDETDQISHKVKGIADNGDRSGNISSDELPGNKNERDDDDDDEFGEIVGVVFFRRRLVESISFFLVAVIVKFHLIFELNK